MTTKQLIKKELRRLWYEIGHKRFSRCIVCHKSPVELHHAISSSHVSTAYDLENMIPLCPAHHRGSELSPHGTPASFLKWLEEYRPEEYEYYQANRNKLAPSIGISYYQEKIKWLEKILLDLNQWT